MLKHLDRLYQSNLQRNCTTMSANRKSQVQTKHRDRTVNVYPILEYELDLLRNGQASGSFYTTLSAVSFTILLAVSVPLIITDPSGLNQVAKPYLVSICVGSILLGMASGIKAFVERKKTKKMVDDIKEQLQSE